MSSGTRPNIWGFSSAGRALAWHARGHRFDPGNLHQKSTVLRRKYGAFLFTEAGFWGLHCFACTVFRLLQAVPIQPPTFDFTPFSKKNVCRPVFQQAAASSPSMYGRILDEVQLVTGFCTDFMARHALFLFLMDDDPALRFGKFVTRLALHRKVCFMVRVEIHLFVGGNTVQAADTIVHFIRFRFLTL